MAGKLDIDAARAAFPALSSGYLYADNAGGSRFGNKRFRDFLDAVRAHSTTWHHNLGVSRASAAAEASAYLAQSFGNRSRIEYGSGHELNFLMWILCLYQLSILRAPADLAPLVLRVFPRYLALMSLVQTTYYLEPAG